MRTSRIGGATVAALALLAAGAVPPASAALATGGTPATHARLHDDFNGDGYSDLALGMPNATVGGKSAAGYLAVVYGSANGLDPAARQVFSQSTAGVSGTAESGDRFGYAVASGDLNRDGFADLVTSSAFETVGTRVGSGALTILWGGPKGLRGGTAVDGVNAYDGLGSSLAVGDFTGDRRPDIAAAGKGDDSGSGWFVPGPFRPKDAPAAPRRFAVTEFGGTDADVAAGDVDGDGTLDLVLTFLGRPASATGVYRWNGSVVEQTARLSGGGLSAAVADFDRDGYADIAVGYWHSADGGAPQPHDGGLVKVDYGGPDGPSAHRRPDFFGQDSRGVPGTGSAESEWGDRFGQRLSAGDADGDRYPDLAVGIPGENDATGRAVLLRGGAGGLTGRGAQSFHQDTKGIPGVNERQDQFGSAVRLVDLDSDGRADLAVGAPTEDFDRGRVWTLPGTAKGLTAAGSRAYFPADLRVPASVSTTTLGSVIGR